VKRRRHTLALLAVLCAGCQQEAGAPPASSAATPISQRLVDATISDPKTFNPILVTDNASGEALRDVFDGLLRLNPLTTEMEPDLAERWAFSDDGRVCTLFLRHDVRWHDDVPFTAHDVAFTFAAIFDERVVNSAKYVLMVDGQPPRVEVVDDYTVRLVLPRAFAPLLSALGQPIVPQHLLAAALADGTFAQQWGINTPPEQIVGTGPFRMVRYVPAQLIEFARNPHYWMKDDAGRPLPYLDSRVQLIVPNQDTAYLKFLAGQTDTHPPRPEEIADLRAKAQQLGVTVQELGLETGTTFVSFNRNPRHYVRDGQRDPRLDWFSDPRFLRALAHGFDKQAMIVSCLNGYGKPAVAEISPENKRYHNPNLTDYAYDLDTARQLLREAGFVDRNGDGIIEDAAGNAVEFSLTTNAENQVRQKMCSVLVEDWTKLGMKVNYRPLDFTTLVDKLTTTFDWDAVLIGFTGTVEPNNGANLLRSSGNLHLWNPSQPQPATAWEGAIDRLLDQGAHELDLDKRRVFYWRIQDILHEQLPMMQTVRAVQFIAFKNILQNYRPTVWGFYRPELIRLAR
jgi:peptide/nickel transport system substrate-binding protein